eukprot:g34758.t1
MSQAEWSLRKVDKEGEGSRGENVSGDGISLEVMEIVPDDLLDVDAGGMVGARVLDATKRTQDNLKQEGKQTEVIVHIGTNDI